MTIPRSIKHLALAALCLTLTTGAARADSLTYGKSQIQVAIPGGFTEVSAIAPELAAAVQKDLDGELLRLYLPNIVLQRYQEGRPDTVTRQICLYGVKSIERFTLDKKALDFMAKSWEGALDSFRKIPAEVQADPNALREFYGKAIQEGASVYVDGGPTDNAFTYLMLAVYPMNKDVGMATALSTSLIEVAGTVVMLSVSSVVTDTTPDAELEWVKSTAAAFTSVLLAANKN